MFLLCSYASKPLVRLLFDIVDWEMGPHEANGDGMLALVDGIYTSYRIPSSRPPV
jgi:hypothetical protein